jgi:tRNA wybutosine-synthesizing protein 2
MGWWDIRVSMRVVRVRKEDADEALRRLLEADIVERGHRVLERGGDALIPIRAELPPGLLDDIAYDMGEVDDRELPPRVQLQTPFEMVVEAARRSGWSSGEVELLPDRWERLGRVLLLKLPEGLLPRAGDAAGLYAKVLGVGAVLLEEGAVTGLERRPTVRLVWGEGTLTVHREHGVEYEFDAARQMFSKGNVHERLRMGRAVRPGETVVDMFAGIGYFSLPMAVLGEPRRVVAIEIDTEAHEWLARNVKRNGVSDVVETRLGDCMEVAPEGVADRVVMGYVGGTEAFLDVAIRAIGDEGGVLHLHDKYGLEEVPSRPMAAIEEAAARRDRTARMLGWREVKSYAPAVIHAVVDAEVR